MYGMLSQKDILIRDFYNLLGFCLNSASSSSSSRSLGYTDNPVC